MFYNTRNKEYNKRCTQCPFSHHVPLYYRIQPVFPHVFWWCWWYSSIARVGIHCMVHHRAGVINLGVLYTVHQLEVCPNGGGVGGSIPTHTQTHTQSVPKRSGTAVKHDKPFLIYTLENFWLVHRLDRNRLFISCYKVFIQHSSGERENNTLVFPCLHFRHHHTIYAIKINLLCDEKI